MKRKLSRVLAGSVFVVLILTAIYAIMSKREQYIAGETNKKNVLNKYTTSSNQLQTVDESNYYKIEKQDMLYYYTIFDKNKNIVMRGEPSNKKPEIMMINDNVIKIINKAGTGIATQSCFYIDVERLLLSPIYSSVLAEYNEIIAHATYDSIIICSIFDKESFYKEILTFNQPFSPVAFPFLGAEFFDGGSCLRVTYLTGENYNKTEEIFKLDE